MAHERRRDGALRILPVRMDFTGDLGYDLASYLNPLQYALWRAGEPFAPVIEELGRAIEPSAALSHKGVAEADALALLHEAIKERSAGRLEEALGTYEELRRVDPNHTDVRQGIATIRGRLLELGDQALAQKDVEKARDYFRRAKDAGAAEADQRLKSVVAKIEERKAQDERERLLREQALAERHYFYHLMS